MTLLPTLSRPCSKCRLKRPGSVQRNQKHQTFPEIDNQRYWFLWLLFRYWTNEFAGVKWTKCLSIQNSQKTKLEIPGPYGGREQVIIAQLETTTDLIRPWIVWISGMMLPFPHLVAMAISLLLHSNFVLISWTLSSTRLVDIIFHLEIRCSNSQSTSDAFAWIAYILLHSNMKGP